MLRWAKRPLPTAKNPIEQGQTAEKQSALVFCCLYGSEHGGAVRHLQNYLNERTDANPALFVSLKAPHERLMIGGVEARLRELGKRLNLPKVHPHKFRRTLATSAIDKGMPIEQVQQLLGHQKIDTTMHYAMVKQQNVKLAHRKYIG